MDNLQELDPIRCASSLSSENSPDRAIQSNLGLEEEEAQSLVDSSIKKAEEFSGLLS